ncbi:MAG: MotA/TolQ/ExbB proton channel family protein [Myxococcota bacterium]
MTREATCPYCGERTARAAEPGVWRCAACGRSFLDASEAASTEHEEVALPGDPTDVRAPIEIGRPARRAPGEVSSVPALGWAIGSSGLFYGVLALLPASRVGELFTARGWVPYAITGISFWALCLLAARARRLARERALLDRDPLHGVSATPLDRRAARREIERLASLPEAERESFVVDRLLRTLRHFAIRPRVGEVVEFLSGESRADEARVDASYALVRVFVWAVPTLGFIGTVLGIGSAVAGFSQTLEAAASLDGMKESIGSVTLGLGVAFDTTLLALVMSILIMFPASAVQRLEEGLLAAVDDYCGAALIARLDERGSSADPTDSSEASVERLARRLVQAIVAARDEAAEPERD